MTDIVLSEGPANVQAPPRKTNGVSVEVTVFSNRYPTGKTLACAVTVVSYSQLWRRLRKLTAVTIILPPDVTGLAPLPADVFHTVVAALTAAVVAEVRAKHSLAPGSPLHDVTMTGWAGQ